MPSRFLNNININDEYSLPSADGSADQIITTDGAGQLSFVDQSTINAGNAEHVVIYAKNTSGASIAKGTPVYITGTVGATDTVEIAPADAGNSAKMPAVGLLDDTLANNAFGYVITGGFMDNITTDPIDGATPSSNDTVYVKSGGGLTLTKPTGSNLIQNVAKVGKVSGGNAGSLIVSSILRTNDVPNLTTGKIWVGSAANTIESDVVYLDETNDRMGIGTTSPGAKLQIGSATYAPNANLGNNLLQIKSASGFAYLTIGNGDSANATSYIGGASGFTVIGSVADAGTLSEHMRITNTGNVGVGTTSPAEKLTVSGDANVTGKFAVGIAAVHPTIDFYNQGTAYFNGSTTVDDNLIVTNGNVGIGTTSPDVSLTIKTGTSAGIAKISSDGNGARYSANGDVQLFTNNSAYSINFFSANKAGNLMRILNNGNVGIGTTSPSEKLDINQGKLRILNDQLDPQIILEGSDMGRRWVLSQDEQDNIGSTGFYIAEGTNVDANDALLYLTPGGNVGIGTTSPSYKLDVSGDAYIDETLNIETTISGTLQYGYSGVGAGNLVVGGLNFASFTPGVITLMNQDTSISAGQDLGVLQFGGKDDLTNGYANGQIICTTAVNAGTGNSGGGIFRFLLSGNTTGSGPTERMRITNTGNVGIGTTSPSEKLHVYNGTSYVTPISYAANQSAYALKVGAYNNTAFDMGLQLKSTGGGSPYMSFKTNSVDDVITMWQGSVGVGGTALPSYTLDVNGVIRGQQYLRLADTGGTNQFSIRAESTYGTLDNGSKTFNYIASNHLFLVGVSEKMRINSGGSVGIGTTTPSYKLHVKGGSDAGIIAERDTSGSEGQIFMLAGSTENVIASKGAGNNAKQLNFNIGVAPRMVIDTSGNVGIGDSSPSEKLEVNGTIKASATTDAYKGYIKQNVNSYGAEKVENSNYYFTSYNTTTTVTSAQAYNRMVAAYNGRVKKVYIRHGGASTPTATAVNFKKHTNGTTSSTVYSATVANAASANMSAYYEFGNNDFTFNAGDLIGLLYQTTDAFGTASKTMGGVAVTITLEYNIT